MSERVNYYAVERPVFEYDKQLLGAALGQLMLQPNASEYFAPNSPDSLHTTLLGTREFAKVARTRDTSAPIHLIEPNRWKSVLEDGMGKLPGSHDSVRAHVSGLTPLFDAFTEVDGWKSFGITIRNSQLTRERAHMVKMADVLGRKRFDAKRGPEYRHHITLGAIDTNNYDPNFILRAQKLFDGKILTLDPLVVRTTPAHVLSKKPVGVR